MFVNSVAWAQSEPMANDLATGQSIRYGEVFQVDGSDVQNIFFTIDNVLGWKRDGPFIVFFPIALYGSTSAIIIKATGSVEYKAFTITRRNSSPINSGGLHAFTGRVYSSFFTSSLSNTENRSYGGDFDLNLRKNEKIGGNLIYTDNSSYQRVDSYYLYYLKGDHRVGYGNIRPNNVFPSFSYSNLLGLDYFYMPATGQYLNMYTGDQLYEDSYREDGLTYYQPMFDGKVRIGYSLTHAENKDSSENYFTNSVFFSQNRVFEYFNYNLGFSNREDSNMYNTNLTFLPPTKSDKYVLRQVSFSSNNAPDGSFSSFYRNTTPIQQYTTALFFANQATQVLEYDLDRIDGLFNTNLSYSFNNTGLSQQNNVNFINSYNFSKINTRLDGYYNWNSDNLPSYTRYYLSPEIGVIFSGDRLKGWGVFNRNDFGVEEGDLFYQQREVNYLGINRYYYGLKLSGYVGQGKTENSQTTNQTDLFGSSISYRKNNYSVSGSYRQEMGMQNTQRNRAQLVLSRLNKNLSVTGRVTYSENISGVSSQKFVTALLSASYSFSAGAKPLLDLLEEKSVTISGEFFLDANFNGIKDQNESNYKGPLEIDMGVANKAYDTDSGLIVLKDVEERPYFFIMPKGISSVEKYISPGETKKIPVYKSEVKNIQIIEDSIINNAYPLIAKCGNIGFTSVNFSKSGDNLVFNKPSDINCTYEIDVNALSVPMVITDSKETGDSVKIYVSKIKPIIYGEITGKSPKSILIEGNEVVITNNSFEYELKLFKDTSVDIKLPKNCQINGRNIIPYRLVSPSYLLKISCQ